MATVAVLSVGLRANTRQFTSGMQGVIGTLNRFKGVIAGVATGAMVYLAKQQAEQVDLMGKTASKLGMLAEEYSRLEYAAGQSGVATNQFNTATQRLTRRLAEVAATGTGTAKGALDALGVSAQELIALRPEERMLKLADSFGAIDSQAERVRLAFKLFDTEGVNMVNLFQSGAEGMESMFNEADKLGITISNLDTTKAAALVDLTDKLKRVFNGVVRQITFAMAPALLTIGEMILELIKGSGDWGAAVSKSVGWVVDKFVELARVGHFLKGIWTGLRAVLKQISAGLVDLMAYITEWFDETMAESMRDSADDLRKEAQKLYAVSGRAFDNALAPTNKTADQLRTKITDMTSKLEALAASAQTAATDLGTAQVDVAAGPTAKKTEPAIAAVERGSAAAIEAIRLATLKQTPEMRDKLMQQQFDAAVAQLDETRAMHHTIKAQGQQVEL